MRKFTPKRHFDLLVLPGWAMQPNLYAPLVGSLKTKVRSTIVDYGFFPQTGMPSNEPMKMPTLCSDAAPLIILAHSMGALFAFRLAARFPKAVKGVILFGGFARFAEGGKIPGRSIEDISSMRRHLAETPEALLKSFYRASAVPDQLKIVPPPNLNRKALSDGLELLAADDVSDVIPALKAPCLDVVSSGDLIVDSPMSTALATLVPGLQVKHITGAGHLFPLCRPQEAAEFIDKFIEESIPADKAG